MIIVQLVCSLLCVLFRWEISCERQSFQVVSRDLEIVFFLNLCKFMLEIKLRFFKEVFGC